MAVNTPLFETFVETFTDITGKEGVIIFESTGKILFTKFENEISAKNIPGWIKSIINTVNEIIDKSGTADVRQMLLEGTERKILIQNIPEDNLHIVLTGKASMKVGLARLALNKIVEEWKKKAS